MVLNRAWGPAKMPLPVWPTAVRGGDRRVLKDGFTPLPADNILRSETDQGAKTRRRSTARRHVDSFRLRLPRSEFEAFENWVADDLKDGTKWFVWQPPRRTFPVKARFIEQDGRPFQPSTAPGDNYFVALSIEYFDRPFTNA